MKDKISGKSSQISSNFTPREVVSELDKYIVGQDEAKKSVAIALRNRWRRQQVTEDIRDDILPKNIIMIGPTGVGKTEIARRLAKLAQAPFLKVEASKFTEVGYVGRDVDSMIRDLVEISVKMLKDEEIDKVEIKAAAIAEERLLDLLIPPPPQSIPQQTQSTTLSDATEQPGQDSDPGHLPSSGTGEILHRPSVREKFRQMLREGKLDDRYVELEVPSSGFAGMQVFGPQGMEEMMLNLQDMVGNLTKGRGKKRKIKVPEALKLLSEEESSKLVDMDKVTKEALERVEQSGIIFLDEIDKIASRERGGHGPDVSREGVQRDLLPIVEGSKIVTKYGIVNTDHVLFIAAGAFNVSKPSDLIPELQGRFPIRVELHSLGKKEFERILIEPRNSLIRQYTELLTTEGVEIKFTEDAIHTLADIANHVNSKSEDIGARRLHTVMEKLLEDISFNAPEMNNSKVMIDGKYVKEHLEKLSQDEDLSKYIL